MQETCPFSVENRRRGGAGTAECTIVLLIVHTALPLIMKLDFDHEIVGKKNE